MAGGLLTDLYELNMAASYLRRGMTERATFSLFVRELPPERGFLVAAGLDECLRFLESFAFSPDELAHLRGELGFDDAALDAFGRLRFTGDVWAVPEGRIVFAGEPLLEVTAPIAEAQLVETVLLNHVTLHTTIASKAARCLIAAAGADLVDFAFRRTHGVEAAMAVARSCAMVGFAATSNVEAARRLGMRAAGTMAHSYIEAFPSEMDAFRAFAEDLPGRTTFLVDTYDTEQGIRNAIGVIRELGLREGLAVRLDSGDIGALAMCAREMLEAAGLPQVRIFASGALDEYAIDEFVRGAVPIDAYGVGTRLGVSADTPSLDSVYKLVAYGSRDVMKLSTGKATLPGAKQVFRELGSLEDLLGVRSEPPPGAHEPLLVPVMRDGRRVSEEDGLSAARERFARDLALLPADARRIRDPRPLEPALSPELRRLMDEVRSRSH